MSAEYVGAISILVLVAVAALVIYLRGMLSGFTAAQRSRNGSRGCLRRLLGKVARQCDDRA